MSHVRCLDIDRWYLCTSIDINLHLSRHLMMSIDNTGCVSIDCSSSRRPLHGQLGECFTLGVSIIGCKDFRQVSRAAGSVTQIGQGSMNQNLMRALKIAVSKSRFELFYWSLYESSLNGVTFQTCLKNPIPCIPSPKTSGYVRFSVGNQLWLLHTFKA
ncbi:hypothetical protein IGI04_007058, partial [Brassica rapa subsp. trilocularis]